MRIENGHVVTLEYSLKDAAGHELESSAAAGPITFTLGVDHMLPGLLHAIEGMSVGETRQGIIPPGQLVPREITAHRIVKPSEFPAGAAPKVGDRFQAKGADGRPLLFEVRSQLPDGSFEVDLLHALHDVEVHYTVTVLNARRMGVPPPPPVDVPDLSDELVTEEG